MSNLFPQSRARSMERDAHDQRRRIHHLRNLAIAVPFEVTQREHLTRRVTELGDCFANQFS
jgi:hypothetical protein